MTSSLSLDQEMLDLLLQPYPHICPHPQQQRPLTITVSGRLHFQAGLYVQDRVSRSQVLRGSQPGTEAGLLKRPS